MVKTSNGTWAWKIRYRYQVWCCSGNVLLFTMWTLRYPKDMLFSTFSYIYQAIWLRKNDRNVQNQNYGNCNTWPVFLVLEWNTIENVLWAISWLGENYWSYISFLSNDFSNPESVKRELDQVYVYIKHFIYPNVASYSVIQTLFLIYNII